ncbi:hypothetical protein TNIN_245091 [Trichonephila inaurata madagascariensis]|uniref:Uncharacterized protein n=1 Tax=Trichonephila inaurata madagascariensis TaxID=2747483 RepID=A0A8X7C6S1_9ARAC|nr:hypothetical protein TNIN_245091 [Trichonephila inaurata madagascariensis]
MSWSRKKYQCIPSSIRTVRPSADMPIPDPPKKYEIVKDDVEEEFIRPGISCDPDFEAKYMNEPLRLNQAELSDLVRHLDLP